MRIQLYVLRQLLLSIVFAVSGLAVIVMPTIAIQAVNRLGAISAGTVARYLPLVVAELAPYLLPMAFLLAVVATYGRLAAERELIAIKMAGIHPAKLAIPGFLVAVPLALGTDRLLAEISPDLNFEKRNLLTDSEVARVLANMTGSNLLQFGKNVLTSESNHGNVRTGVVLSLQPEGREPVQISASEARIDLEGDSLVLRMKDTRVLGTDSSFNQGVTTKYWKLSELYPREKKERDRAKYLGSGDMAELVAHGALPPAQRDDYVYEIQRRHALSATYLLFLLLGIPTGVVLRSSTQLGAFTGAVGYAFLYYVLAMRLGKVLGATGAISPVFAAWATNGLFLVVGLVFFVRALWR